jgi:hypothetical protein
MLRHSLQKFVTFFVSTAYWMILIWIKSFPTVLSPANTETVTRLTAQVVHWPTHIFLFTEATHILMSPKHGQSTLIKVFESFLLSLVCYFVVSLSCFFYFFSHVIFVHPSLVLRHRNEFVPGGCSRVRTLVGTVTFRRPIGSHGALLPRVWTQFQIGQRRRRSHPGKFRSRFWNHFARWRSMHHSAFLVRKFFLKKSDKNIL